MTESTCIVEWCPRPPGGDGVHCKPHRDYVARKGRLPNRPSFYDERRRLWERIEVDEATSCWTWMGTLNSNGYGRVQFRGRVIAAHRAMWIRERGEIPPGLDLDHLCRNRRCMNPDHLEPVTREENLRRGDGTTATATHCANGHPWADDNRAPASGRRVAGLRHLHAPPRSRLSAPPPSCSARRSGVAQQKVATMVLPWEVLQAIRATIGDRTSGAVFVRMQGVHKGDRLARPDVAHVIEALCRRAGITRHITPHSFRRSFAKTAHMQGRQLHEIQEAMRHADSKMTSHYIGTETTGGVATQAVSAFLATLSK